MSQEEQSQGQIIEKPKEASKIGFSKLGIELKSFEELYRFATVLAKSSFLPKQYANKSIEQRTYDAMAAIQLGMEIGLSPMAAIQSIAVVNGQPNVWGDVQLGVVIASGKMKEWHEWDTGTFSEGNFTAHFKAERIGDPHPVLSSYSIEDAKTAKLWGKEGSWTTHPKRMLKYKARSFGLRDKFPDVLKGIHSSEEMEGEIIDTKLRDGKYTPEPVVLENQNPEKFEMFKKELAEYVNPTTFYKDVMGLMDTARKELNTDEYKELQFFGQQHFKLLNEKIQAETNENV